MSSTAFLDSIVSPERSQQLASGTVITIGNFDGVHRGHQRIIQTVREAAAKRKALSLALTFEPHPTTVFQHRAPETFRLTSAERRTELLKSYGVDAVVTVPFSRDFADLTPSDFVNKFLSERLHAKEVHIGYDFAFGRGREGTTSNLQELCAKIDVDVVIHRAYEESGSPISSTRVRAALQQHAMEEVAQLYGRPYTIHGVQAPGAQRGRAMGIPTINLYPEGLLLPPHGVYVSEVRAEGTSWRAITNLGVRPTFVDDDRVSVETFILDPEFREVRAGERIEVRLHKWVREERAFPSAEALKKQIGQDVAVAQAFHNANTTT